MPTKYEFREHFLYAKDFKQLAKKVASLPEDLVNFRKFIGGVDFTNNKRFVTLHHDCDQQIRIVKTRLMARSLKGSSQLRLVFLVDECLGSILLIELYLKSQQAREDEARIQKCLKQVE